MCTYFIVYQIIENIMSSFLLKGIGSVVSKNSRNSYYINVAVVIITVVGILYIYVYNYTSHDFLYELLRHFAKFILYASPGMIDENKIDFKIILIIIIVSWLCACTCIIYEFHSAVAATLSPCWQRDIGFLMEKYANNPSGARRGLSKSLLPKLYINQAQS